MASRLALQHRYPKPPERIREVLTDQRYLQDKLRAVGGRGAELVSHNADERGITVVIHQAVPGDVLPPFLRSARPNGLTIRRTETWSSSGGSVHAVVEGVPGTITGAMHLAPEPEGCVLGAHLAVEVGLPLIGGTVEKAITDGIARLMETEYHFTLEWLRNPTV